MYVQSCTLIWNVGGWCEYIQFTVRIVQIENSPRCGTLAAMQLHSRPLFSRTQVGAIKRRSSIRMLEEGGAREADLM